MTKVVFVGSSLKIGPAVAGSAGPIPAPLLVGYKTHERFSHENFPSYTIVSTIP